MCILNVCVEFYREELCVGEENVEVNYAFFRGEGCIYVCAYVGDGQIVYYICSSMCGLYVCVCECLTMHEKEKL